MERRTLHGPRQTNFVYKSRNKTSVMSQTQRRTPQSSMQKKSQGGKASFCTRADILLLISLDTLCNSVRDSYHRTASLPGRESNRTTYQVKDFFTHGLTGIFQERGWIPSLETSDWSPPKQSTRSQKEQITAKMKSCSKFMFIISILGIIQEG